MKEKGEIKEISHFQHIAMKLQLQKEVITKEELIRLYMEELKKDLVKNLVEDNKSDVSMVGSSNEECLVGKSQYSNMEEISEEDIDQMVREIEQQAREEIFQKSIYYPSAGFISATLCQRPSYAWRSIWEARGLLEEEVRWRVGDGRSIGRGGTGGSLS
ncbi:hypothetical protein M9H77_28759 [Catharanthus roseus]|uniref:Uncharacterized protein n=1 Tax=Catharanthus roseus TaxID=4058 RepID=A0ACC0AGW5_CATRO|nr:hypothetical protein M9H77_28759 [Catharanthus roseus]